MRPSWRLPIALACALTVAGCGASRSATTPAGPAIARTASSGPSHVVTIVQENTEYGDVIGNPKAPFVNALARRYGLATASYGVRHPSLPNYLALTSGSTHGIDSDCYDCHVGARNVVDQLDQAGISWKAYLEGAPGPCYLGADVGRYAKRHNPFSYYDDVARSPARCAKLVPLTQLAQDLRAGTLPTYVWISPDVCDDTHDCPIDVGDRFLAGLVPRLLAHLGSHGLLILTWDEGTTDAGCCAGAADGGRIATIVAGPDVRAGGRSDAPLDQFGVLRTTETALGLPRLAQASDPRNGSLAGLFTRPPSAP
ncbi:MAG TPA: alkaline phosphatase family protein [Conexibacter sp.]|nr:alkaline phosphatase family protein [Conexibacter sp.]